MAPTGHVQLFKVKYSKQMKWYTEAIQQESFLIIFMCTFCPCMHALLYAHTGGGAGAFPWGYEGTVVCHTGGGGESSARGNL